MLIIEINIITLYNYPCRAIFIDKFSMSEKNKGEIWM